MNINLNFIQQSRKTISEVLADTRPCSDWTQICLSIQNAVQAAANVWGTQSDDHIRQLKALLIELVRAEMVNIVDFDISFSRKLSWDKILYCPICGGTNVQVTAWVDPNSHQFIEHMNIPDEVDDCWCEDCEQNTRLLTLPELWADFANVPVNNGDEIKTDFMHFLAGTPKQDVWHWFEARCPDFHNDLLYSKRNPL